MDEIIKTYEALYKDYQKSLKNFEVIKFSSFTSIEFDKFQLEFHFWRTKVENSRNEVNTFLNCLSADSFELLSTSTKYPVHYLE